MFCKLLVGGCPFDNPSAIKTFQKHVLQEPKTLHQIDPKTLLPSSDIMSKLMEKNADLRCHY